MSEESAPLCQVCGEAIEDDVIYCTKCATPHHRDCWDWVGHCSTFACGCGRSSSSQREESEESEDSSEEILEIRGDGASFRGERMVSLPMRERRARTIIDCHGREVRPWAPKEALDLDTPLEKYLQRAAGVLVALSILAVDSKRGEVNWTAVAVLNSLATMILFFRLATTCTYVLDNDNRKILYLRSIFSYVRAWEVCTFDEIKRIGINCRECRHKNHTYWRYSVAMELPHHVAIRISDETVDFNRVYGFAKSLSEHLRCHFSAPVSNRQGSIAVTDEIGVYPMVPKDPGDIEMTSKGRVAPLWELLLVLSASLTVLAFYFN